MKCMTFNVWNYAHNWPRRRAILAELIRRHNPDVAVLQETRHDFRFERGKGQGEQLAELTGYHLTWRVGQVYVPLLRVDEGLSILSRQKPDSIMSCRLSRLPREREDGSQRVCLGIATQIEGTEVHIYTSHFSLSEQARIRNALEVSRFVRQQSGGTPSILMGDLNALPDTPPMQVLRGEVTVDGLTGDFTDCWWQAEGDAPGFTYASWEPVRRIDYVFARYLPTPVHAEVIGGVATDGVYASDHMGVVVEWDVRASSS
ncbi:MAG: endonuclease/exonuclease/phosphatase family protein [Chloroflexota bacterium]